MLLPLVGVTACTFIDKSQKNSEQLAYKIGERYMRALSQTAPALPVLLPVFGSDLDIDSVLAHCDGLLFTGSLSNVHPSFYGEVASAAAEPHDLRRDATNLPLLRAAIENNIPTLCICRGFQELNVVMNGTLHPLIHEVDERMDHRRPEGDIDRQYGPAHKIKIEQGGILAPLIAETGLKEPVMVNSLHYQGIKDLGKGLRIEATAPDGTIEAVSLLDQDTGRQTVAGGEAGRNKKGFLLGVQWHPEYKARENPLSRAIFRAFFKAMTGPQE